MDPAGSVDIAKAERNRRFLGERAQHVESRSRQMARALRLWLRRFAQLVIEEEQPSLVRKVARITAECDKAIPVWRQFGMNVPRALEVFTDARLSNIGNISVLKARTQAEEKLMEELLATVRQFSGQQMSDAANAVTGIPISLSGRTLERFLEDKLVLLQGLADETRASIREGVRVIIDEALREVPRPSAGTIARRIRNQYQGPEDQADFTISSERAALIARTELVQAENTGIVTGYETLGIKEMEWLAFTGDRKSGKRKHWEMNGEKIKVGERFITPLGNKMRYPGDPTAPIAETANCRCTVAPVRRKS